MKTTIIMVPLTEIARQGRVCQMTARRKAEAAGIEPDAVLHAGLKRIPLFVEPRAAEILKAINTNPQTQ